MTDKQKGIGFVLISAVLYSIMPVMIRLLDAGDVPPMSQVFLRYNFAFLAAIVYFLVSKAKFKIKKTDAILIALVSIFGYALSNLMYTYGVINTLASNALFIFFSFAIMTPILAFIFLKEKVNRYNVLGLGIVFVALLLLFRPNSMSTWKIGGFFALLAALGQSIYLVGRRKLKDYSSQLILLTSTFFGVVTLGLLSAKFETDFYINPAGIRSLTPETWGLTIAFGFDNFLAWFFMTKGYQLIKTALASTVLLIENVFIVLFAFMFLNEMPTIYSLIGGGLILIASLIVIYKGDNS